MKEFLDNLVKKGVISQSDKAKWLSPVFYPGKKNGLTHLMTYLRKLNDNLERDEWPMGNFDETLHSIGKFFASRH